MATSFSGRSFTSGLTTAKAGDTGGGGAPGLVWWGVRIVGNDTDDFTRFDFANIDNIDVGFTDSNFQADKLLDISSIDQRGDFFNSPLAKIGDVSFIIENLTGFYDTQRDLEIRFDGRLTTVIMGFGTEVNATSFDTMFKGRIISVIPNRRQLIFKIRGKSQLHEKQIGTIIEEETKERFKGKIIPISHGDWTDVNAYLPTIVKRKFKNVPIIQFDNQPWNSYEALHAWDEENRKSFIMKQDNTKFFVFRVTSSSDPAIGSQYTNNSSTFTLRLKDITASPDLLTMERTSGSNDPLNSGTLTGTGSPLPSPETFTSWAKTGGFNLDITIPEITFEIDTTLTNNIAILQTSTTVNVINTDRILFYQDQPTYIRINDEIMLVWRKPASASVIDVERGAFDTTATAHLIDSNIFQVTENETTGRILVDHDFLAENVGFINFDFSNPGIHIKNTATNFQDIAKDTGRVELTTSVTTSSSVVGSTDVRIIFESISLSGEIINMFLLIDASTTVTRTAGPGPIQGTIQFIESAANFVTALNAVVTTNSTDTDTFNNITGSDDKFRFLLNKTEPFAITRIENLNSTTFDLRGTVSHTNPSTGTSDIDLSRIGMRIEFLIDPEREDLFVRGKARENPGSYHNGLTGTLIERPEVIIEDIARQELGFLDDDLDVGFFNEVFDEHNQKVVFTVTGVSTAPNPGELYTNNGSVFVVVDTNVSGGEGTVTVRRQLGSSNDPEDAPPNRTLVRSGGGVGDDPLTYTKVRITRAEWKMGSTFFGDPKKWRSDILKSLCLDSQLLSSERFDGSLAITVTDIPEPAQVTRAITDAEIVVDSNGLALWDFGYTNTNNIFTRVNIRYQPIIPDENSFGLVKFCDRSGSSEPDLRSNFLDQDDENEFASLLEIAFSQVEEERAATINANHIRDEKTAENYLKNYIRWHYRQLAIIKLTCSYSVIDLEQWSKVKLTSTILPSHLVTGKFYFVQSISINPNIKGKDPTVDLILLEFPTDLTILPLNDEGFGLINNVDFDTFDEGLGEIDNSTFDSHDQGVG